MSPDHDTARERDDAAPEPGADLLTCSQEDLVFARRHLEDLEIFVGQRSRLHPGPGWALVLHQLRGDLAGVKATLARRFPAPA